MLGKDLIVSAYVVVRNGCPLAISIDNHDQANIVCGRVSSDAFEIVMEREALRALVELGADALQRMDAPDPA